MEERQPRKLAVIVHADVVDSTALVQRHESVAHRRIQATFKRFSEFIEAYGGTAQEIRGDALVAEFDRTSDAVSASLEFQDANEAHNRELADDIRPEIRVGISLGEVVIADGTVTGVGVVLAQRLEQLAKPNGVVVQGAVYEAIPSRLPFNFESLGDQTLKGFDQPVTVYAVEFESAKDVTVPEPDEASVEAPRAPTERVTERPQPKRRRHNWLALTAVVIVVIGAATYWRLHLRPPSTSQQVPRLEKLPPIVEEVIPLEELTPEAQTDMNLVALIARGDEYLRLEDFASARLLYEKAAISGSARAATALGKTYDPAYRERANLRVPSVSAEKAIVWYRKALEAGDQEAKSMMRELHAWLEGAAARGDDEAQKLLDKVNL